MKNRIKDFLVKTKYLNNPSKFFFRLYERIKSSNFDQSSTFLAYHLILSFIPMIIFISQVLGYINNSFDDSLIKSMDYLPENIKMILDPVLTQMVNVRSSGLSFLAAFSWLWLGSRGFQGLIKTLNQIFDINKNRNFIVEKLVSIIYMISFIIIFAGILTFNVFNKHILSLIEQYTEIKTRLPFIYNLLLSGIGSLAPFTILTIIFFFFFKFATPNRNERLSFKSAFIGALIVGFGIATTTFIYTYINDNLSKINVYYGSLGGILALLVWILTICQVIVFGAEVSATIRDFEKK